MGSSHSLPWSEHRQRDVLKSWLKQTNDRLDWLYSQRVPADVPEHREAIDYYKQLLEANLQWEKRERESGATLCMLRVVPDRHGPALASLR
jgi:hypothetical protein